MVLAYFDYIFTCIFAIEMFLKILDLGVILHPGSYCRLPHLAIVVIAAWSSLQRLLEHHGRHRCLLCAPCLDVCVSLYHHLCPDIIISYYSKSKWKLTLWCFKWELYRAEPKYNQITASPQSPQVFLTWKNARVFNQFYTSVTYSEDITYSGHSRQSNAFPNWRLCSTV